MVEQVLEFSIARYNYWIVILLMMTGLYIVFSRGNLVKTIVGLNVFQTSVFIFYITIGKVTGGTAPILVGGHGADDHGSDDHYSSGHDDGGHDGDHAPAPHGNETYVTDHGRGPDGVGEAVSGLEFPTELDGVIYSNPLPHVLILTAIVVGVATTAVGLALAIRIREAYGTIEEDDLERIDNEAATGSPFGEGGAA